MSKRTAFTTITPLPHGLGRHEVLEVLHNFEDMIGLNPSVRERHLINPPSHAEKDELDCIWYSLTEKRSSYFPTGLASGDISYPCAFHDLPNGLQIHYYGPAGVDIREKWTLNGRLPGEPVQPVEISVGAPSTGLYIRQDVEMRCSIVTSASIRKKHKKSHTALIDRLRTNAQVATVEEYSQRRQEHKAASITTPSIPSISGGSTTSKGSRVSRRLSWAGLGETPASLLSASSSTTDGSSGSSAWFRTPRSRPGSMFFASKSTTRLPEITDDTIGGPSYEQQSGASRAGSFHDSLPSSISHTPISMYGERPFTSHVPSHSYATSTASSAGSRESAEQYYTIAPPARAPPPPPPPQARGQADIPQPAEEPVQHPRIPSTLRAPPTLPVTADPYEVSPMTPDADPRLLPEPLQFSYRTPVSVPQTTAMSVAGEQGRGGDVTADELLKLLLYEHPDYPHMSPYSDDVRANPLVGQYVWSPWTAAPRCGARETLVVPMKASLAGSYEAS